MDKATIFSQILSSPFLAGLSCGVCLSLAVLYNKVWRVKGSNTDSGDNVNNVEKEVSSDGDGEIKLILVVRTDLKMGKGKAAAQCAHAAVYAYQQAKARNPSLLKKWEKHGQPKIVLKCDNEKELKNLAKLSKEKLLITSVIRDAGRTQIAPNSLTVVGVGPGPVDLIDEVTGHLKLY